MKSQDLKMTKEAEKVAMDILERRLLQPHYVNCREVDILLNKAKDNYMDRKIKQFEIEGRKFEDMLEPWYFDPDYARARIASTFFFKLCGSLEGQISEDIISQIEEIYNKYIPDTVTVRGRSVRPSVYREREEASVLIGKHQQLGSIASA
ncbi:hypothetical protein DFH27DRAFT_525909 [Peziza echinospora]|nr:hypothetical protein DFH27DRAFT_525909 [Peziza echinospora]